ncbi:MAG TPA: hypothetical protein VI756_05380, partial [Blastocatellia bacterium]
MSKKQPRMQGKKPGASKVDDKRPAESVEAKRPSELNEEEADRMVTEALDCDPPEPEPFVKMLLRLSDLHEQGLGPELG